MSPPRRVLAVLLALAGCSRAPEPTRAFYVWRARAALTPAEVQLVEREQVTRLYVRLFDVGLDPRTHEVVPLGEATLTSPMPTGVRSVPVVYLTNAALQQTRDARELADRILARVQLEMAAAGLAFDELQLDCDWTDQTRDAFFAVCERLRAQVAPARLTATIRLHQVKYPKRTGVPPVERGMLMFYNMGQLAPDAERSSIFNVDDASRYAASIDAYPLPLDAVLPVFSWAIHLRNGRIVGLIDKPDAAELAQLPGVRRVDARRFAVERGTLWNGTYLQEGDALRIEAMTPARAQEAAALLAHNFHPRGPFALALFDLDARNLDAYSHDDLDRLFTAVR